MIFNTNISAPSGGGGGGGASYLVSITFSGMTSSSGGTISLIDYGGSTLADIINALNSDPTTRVTFKLSGLYNGNNVICEPISTVLRYYAPPYDSNSDLEFSFAIWSNMNGDTDRYLLRVYLSQSYTSVQKQNTI